MKESSTDSTAKKYEVITKNKKSNTIKRYEVIAKNKGSAIRRRVHRFRWGCRFGCENGLIELENEESVECPDCYYLKYRQTNTNQTNIDRGLNHYNDIFPQRNKSKIFNEHYPYRYKYPKKETNYIGTFLWIAAIFLAFCIFVKAGG